MKQKVTAVVYGGDTCNNGTKCGENTMLRCDKFVRFALENFYRADIYVIFAAGTNPQYPFSPQLKELMKEYTEQKMRKEFPITSPLPITFLLAKDDVWKTLPETVAAIKTIEEEGLYGPIYIFSSNDHLYRIKLIWKLLFHKKVSYIGVPSTHPWLHQFLYETAAIFDNFPKIVIHIFSTLLKK